ncbi:MAG TPA: hypothetical protein VGQ06_04330 [Gemmatimonadales bacterium]|jgi:cell division protein FtsB|nr:hypothetical protein [Gemmatimonadales bacterium]
MYVADRLEVREAIDQLEAILRDVAEELAGWRARALKAEAELKRGSGERGAGTAPTRPDPTLEAENKVLRLRVEAARTRVHDLLQRLTFLEEQARDPVGGSGNGGGASGSGGSK